MYLLKFLIFFRIPYFVSLSKQYPGKFLVSYMPRTKPRHEYATISPEGIRYRQQMFHSLNSMMRWFKEHFRDPIPGIYFFVHVFLTLYHDQHNIEDTSFV